MHLPDRHKTFLRVQTAGHMCYFGTAFIIEHNFAALALLVLCLIGLLMHDDVVK